MPHRPARALGRRLIPATAVAAIATLGLVTALVLAPPAQAYSIDQLPGLGYSVSVLHLANGCSTWQAGYGNASKTDLGSDCDADFQSRVDALVNATCPCAQPPATAPPPPPPTTTAPADTTTVPPATTATVTTTTPAPPAPAAQTLPSAPTADFTAASPNPNVVAFTDTSTAGGSAIGSRVWQFGDGTGGTGVAPVHPYPGPGSYFVTLISVDTNGLTSIAVHELTIAADHSVVLGPRTTQAVVTAAAHRTVDVRNGDVVRVNGGRLRCVVAKGSIVCGLPPGKGGVWAYVSPSAVAVTRAKKTAPLVMCLHRPQVCRPG